MKKTKFIDVADFVEKNSDCLLVSTEYKGQLVPLKMICGCGNPFEVTYKQFKRPLDSDSNKGKRWCNDCGQKRSNAGRIYKIEDMVDIALESKCILLSKEYSNCKQYLSFQCECGELFQTTWDMFMNNSKRQCNPCGQILNNLPSKKTNELFKKQVFELVGSEYNPMTEYLFAKTHIMMKHNVCNYVYPVTPDQFLRERGCPKCSNAKNSKLSRAVEYWLEENELNFVREFKIEECRNEKVLPFDFAIFDKNNSLILIVEVDGEQHFKPARFSKDKNLMLKKFNEIQFRDNIKNKFCEDNAIPLLRIKYNEMRHFKKKIEEMLLMLKQNNRISCKLS